MKRRYSLPMGVLVLMLMQSAWVWGQTDDRLGQVLAVEGTAEVRAARAATWEPLQFRAVLFPNDTVRTAANSKVKVLLRDESIMTLAERSEMQFTEFVLTPQQRRTVVGLTLGKLRVVATNVFGAGSTTEVRTANTVAGVRGTTFVVVFIPPEETQVIALEGEIGVSNVRTPQRPQLLSANFITRVVGDALPAQPRGLSFTERQGLALELRLTEQIPTEVRPMKERQTADGIRGDPTVGKLAAALAPLPQLPQGPGGVQLGKVDSAVQLAQLTERTGRVNALLSSEPPGLQGSPVITPDNIQTATTVLQQPSNLRLTISIPRR